MVAGPYIARRTMASGDIVLSNYAAAFVDLLGQRSELAGCDLLPSRKEDVLPLVQTAIGSVQWLHDRFDMLYRGATEDPTHGDKSLDHPRAHEIRKVALKYQRFSDGILFYVSLFGPPRPEIINGLFGLVMSSGGLCFQGLTDRRPIRGGIAVAWGGEINDNELYGCIMARAYELESTIALFPRIVVSEHLFGYLESVAQLEGDDITVQYSRRLAIATLELLGRDTDGVPIVDYLGAGFRKHLVDPAWNGAYKDALSFIGQQLHHWQTDGNDEKLARRYRSLRAYFATRGFA